MKTRAPCPDTARSLPQAKSKPTAAKLGQVQAVKWAHRDRGGEIRWLDRHEKRLIHEAGRFEYTFDVRDGLMLGVMLAMLVPPSDSKTSSLWGLIHQQFP